MVEPSITQMQFGAQNFRNGGGVDWKLAGLPKQGEATHRKESQGTDNDETGKDPLGWV
jgi:hypothetical protein